MARTAQMPLFRPEVLTRRQRVALIRMRLDGYSYRQAAREARRRRRREASERKEAVQITIEEMIARARRNGQ